MKKFLVFLCAMSLVFGVVGTASAITINGLTFTELTVDLNFTSGSGSGSTADPIVLYEDVFGLDVTMSIRGLNSFGNLSGSGHVAGFWLEKHVTNKTGQIWSFYDHELQETLGVPSPDGDGLSFAQGYSGGRPWYSDKFTTVDEIIDVRDYINFSGASVAPDETVIFRYIITDNTPIELFYLRQRPNYQPGSVPEPATMLLLGSGLIGLGVLGRKKLFKKA